MTTTRKRTGFFDLPLELRQTIYTHFLPTDRKICYPLSRFENAPEKTASAVCAAHPVLYQELEDWLYKHCGAILKFSPDRDIDLPYGVKWDRFRSIDVQIDYMTRPGTRPENLVGLQQTISSLLHGQPEQLPDTCICFLEDDRYRGALLMGWPDNPYGGTGWYEMMAEGTSHRWPEELEDIDCRCAESTFGDGNDDSDDSDDGERGSVNCLRTTGDYHEPIAVLVQEAFLQLPPCKSIHVWGLKKLKFDCLADDEKMCFDDNYWLRICYALRLWLEVEQEDAALPQGRDRFERPVLEQLAYMVVDENGTYANLSEYAKHARTCDRC